MNEDHSLGDAYRVASESMKTASDDLERYTASAGTHDTERMIELISTVAAAQREVAEVYLELQRSRAARLPQGPIQPH